MSRYSWYCSLFVLAHTTMALAQAAEELDNMHIEPADFSPYPRRSLRCMKGKQVYPYT